MKDLWFLFRELACIFLFWLLVWLIGFLMMH